VNVTLFSGHNLAIRDRTGECSCQQQERLGVGRGWVWGSLVDGLVSSRVAVVTASTPEDLLLCVVLQSLA